MALLGRPFRLSFSRLSTLSPALSACSSWVSPTAAVGSPQIRAGLAPVEPDLPPTGGPVRGTCVGSPMDAHDRRIANLSVVCGCKIASIDSYGTCLVEADTLPKPVSIYPRHDVTGIGRKTQKIISGSMTVNARWAMAMPSLHFATISRPFSSFPEDITSQSSSVMYPSSADNEILLSQSQNSILLPGKVPSAEQLSYRSSLNLRKMQQPFCSAPATNRGFSTWTIPATKILAPPPPRIIQPGLPALTQLNFLSPDDVKQEEWCWPIEYIQRKPAVVNIHGIGLMLVESGRKLVRSLVKLVAFNKKRGYDIARSLTMDNLLVSKTHGTFAVKDLYFDHWSENSPFMGYKAASKLLMDLLEAVYWDGIISHLRDDVKYYFDVLCHDPPDERRILYSAALLPRSGRMGLSIRLDNMLRHELRYLRVQDWDVTTNTFFTHLPYTSDVFNHYPTDKLHSHFYDWRQHSLQQSSAMMPYERKRGTSRSDCKLETGRWLVILNRHGIVHPKGTLADSIDLLHYHLPMYLVTAQDEAIYHRWWRWLHMTDFFPEDNIIGPTVTSEDS